MVIQCSACDTRFKIADDKLKPGGVKVRCSKCQEVFTVMPPEEEEPAFDMEETPGFEPASEPAADDGGWNDLSASFDDNAASEPTTDEGGWNDLAQDMAEDSTASVDAPSFDDFSLGDDLPADEPAEESFSFNGTTEDEQDDSFSFGLDSDDTAEESSTDVNEEAFAFGGGSTAEPEENLGEGAQDEFAFDESGNISLDSDASSDDFDWGDNSATSDSLDFDTPSATGSNEGLDFSGISLQDDGAAPAIRTVAPQLPPKPAQRPEGGPKRPANTKGPQKTAGSKKRGATMGRHSAKKKKGPWRTLAMLVLLVALLLGGGLYSMQQMGYWNGDFAQVASADFVGFGEALWARADAEIQKLLNNKPPEPAGSIAVTDISGRFVDNKTAGRLFVIDGKVRNDFLKTRSAIAVRGILYNAAGKAVAQQKAFCGNVMNTAELASLPIAKILERSNNQFGDALSNLDVQPKDTLAFTVVFNNIPADIVEYNVEIAESSPGSQP